MREFKTDILKVQFSAYFDEYEMKDKFFLYLLLKWKTNSFYFSVWLFEFDDCTTLCLSDSLINFETDRMQSKIIDRGFYLIYSE